MRFSILLSSLAVAMSISISAHANNIGVYGTLYGIQEEDSVQYLKRRMGEMVKDGTVHKKQIEAREHARDSLMHPKPVPGITTSNEHRVFYWDPTMVLKEPIKDSKGNVLFPVGYKLNPLQYGGLSKRLVFIDQRDESQVKLVLQDKKNYPRDEIILTGGSFFELSKLLKESVFYDQNGFLTRKFGIKHVPAIVEQDGLRMKIEEGVAL